jgi:hypothetical protein
MARIKSAFTRALAGKPAKSAAAKTKAPTKTKRPAKAKTARRKSAP